MIDETNYLLWQTNKQTYFAISRVLRYKSISGLKKSSSSFSVLVESWVENIKTDLLVKFGKICQKFSAKNFWDSDNDL